jgi:hypothetical protein
MKLKSKKMKSAIEDSSFLFVSQKSLNAVFERLKQFLDTVALMSFINVLYEGVK